MATEKTNRSIVAAIHAFVYSLPFLLLDISLLAWLAIAVPHFFIDRFRLARHVIYAKNFLSPRRCWLPWKDCDKTGYPNAAPEWLTVWLLIITDNIIHVITNGIALYYL